MENRETQFITTPTGRSVELKTYITGREKRAIESVYYRDVEMTATAGEQTVKGFKAAAIEEAQNTAIATVVVSIDGNKDNILNQVLDMQLEDYEAVLVAIEGVTADKKSAEHRDALAQFINGRLTGDVLMLAICERMGWTYDEYLDQPAWLLGLIVRKMEIEAKKEKALTKNHGNLPR